MTSRLASRIELFKEAASLFASGVTVVAARTDATIHGITVSSFAALSLEPSMVLACIAYNSRVLPLVRESGAFGISILAEGQEEIARDLARSTRGLGEGLEGLTRPGRYTGAPILEGCLAYFECTLREEVVGGDHAILLGHVEDAGRGSGRAPLIYFNREFRRLV